MSWSKHVEDSQFDPKDTNPWAALYLDTGLPLADNTKSALLNNQNSWSRRILLPIIRPLTFLLTILFQLIRFFIPNKWRASKTLHRLIYLGLKYFVRPDASYLIIRHFNIGSAILKFIADNANVHLKSTIPLKPKNLDGLIDHTFLIHDINIFNFVTELNTVLREEKREIAQKELCAIDFSAISEENIDIEIPKRGLFNVIDLQSAIEMYTPLFALLLTENDFWRANCSLQLDETIAVYIGLITGEVLPISLVTNKHPMIPYSSFNVGFRLMIHGLDAELLYAYLLKLKSRGPC
jgi:hypothetical protein